MNEKSWNDFEKTGKISDYLSYKMQNPNGIGEAVNTGKIKPALAADVGREEQSPGIQKLHLTVDKETQNADKNEGYHS